ncbi:copper resistance CopC/CopD family protein [Polymorphospora lycopeni]|uniref:Copper resistance protein CopC n=1 Tax=Polymorphospora lycopeni TaxID=3140240 RepID=A0ABV5CUA9_9ACTN
MTAADHRLPSPPTTSSAPARRATPRRCAALLAVLVAALATLLVPATPAYAHAVLSSTSPVAETVVPTAPAEVVLTFSESVRKVTDKIRVIGPDGARVDRGEPAFNGSVVTIPVDQGGARGTYLVSYRVISADSHPVSGAFTYSVGNPSEPPTDDGSDRADPVVAAAIPVAKYVGYTGLLLVVGPVLVLMLLWPQRLSRAGPARLVWTGAGLITVSALAAIWLQVPYTNGGGIFDGSGAALGDVLGSLYGTVHLVRLGILLAAAFLLWPLLHGDGRATRSDQVLLGILGGAALLTWPLSGHAAAALVPAVSVVVDAVHLAAMAVWLGGLVMLVAFLLRQADDRELGAILPVWSRWATFAVCALLLAGVVQALLEVGTPQALISTRYGQLIIAKVVLFAVVLAVAAFARRLVQRRTAPEEPGRMRKAVWLELGIAAIILAVSAVLVQTTPARTAVAGGADGGVEYFTTTATSSIYSLQIEMDPAARGNNSLHMYAYTLDNRPLPVVEWRATIALPDQGVEPIDIALLKLTDNHAFGEIRLPAAGDWQMRVTVRISEIDQDTVTVTVPVT